MVSRWDPAIWSPFGAQLVAAMSLNFERNLSFRATPASREGLTLLPFSMHPPDITLETKPPSLPARNSAFRGFAIATVCVLVLVGVFSVCSAIAEPSIRGGQQLADGVRSVVSGALARASAQAEASAAEHANARTEYFRRLEIAEAAAAKAKPVRHAAVPSAPSKAEGRRSILHAFADIRHGASPPPDWSTDWKDDAFKRDLVLALAALAARSVAAESE